MNVECVGWREDKNEEMTKEREGTEAAGAGGSGTFLQCCYLVVGACVTSTALIQLQSPTNSPIQIHSLQYQILFIRISHHQGPDLYAFIGFIGPDDINYMCYILVIKY